MKAAIIVFAVLAAVIFVILLFPVRLEILYVKDEASGEISAVCRYMFFKFRLLPQKKKDTAESGSKTEDMTENKPKGISFEKKKEELHQYINLFAVIKDDAAEILRYAAKKAVVFERISVDVVFGFEDAMQTGIFTGLINGFVYNVLALVHNFMTLLKMNVNIQPVFEDTPVFKTRLECILRLKNVHIIIIAFNVLKLIRKIKKAKGSL